MKRACVNSKVEPDEKPTTMLDCQVGQHKGIFPITRTAQGWACPQHGGQP